jgi:predicted RNA binding protein YcfA (HicA-like mRNA interferase family)
MKLPRAASGPELVKSLRMLGYAVDRQRGSRVRVTTQQDGAVCADESPRRLAGKSRMAITAKRSQQV